MSQQLKSKQNTKQTSTTLNNHILKQLEIKDIPNPSIFSHTQSRIILFSYNPAENQQSPCEIMLLEQTSKKTKTLNQEQQMIKMMNDIGLENKVQQKLFLKKINNEQRKWLTNELNDGKSIAFKQGLKDRLERRRSKFQASSIRRQSMNLASSEVIAQRKIKVVNMNSLMKNYNKKEIIQLGNQQFQFQDLSQTNQKQQYYTLIKKVVDNDQHFPRLSIPETLLSKIEFQAEVMKEDQIKYDDDFDSNDEDNPDYDYPDQEYEQNNSRSSQEIIRDYDDYDYEQRSDGQDEQYIYQQYLRRVRRRQQQMQTEQYYEDYD